MDKPALLYRAYLDGDEKAFEELVLLLKDNLIYFIERFVKNPSVAEDIAQDSFVELLLHKHSYNFKTPLKTYLFTIGRNKAFNFLKKNSRHPGVDISELEYSLEDETNIEDKVICDERKRRIVAALNRINPDYKDVLYLIYFEGMSGDEAASILKKNKKQMANLLFRAKEAAKKEFEKEGLGDEIR